MRPYRIETGGLILFIRVTPRAGADRIDGVVRRDDGSAVLRLRVRAVADGGRANAAVLAMLAAALGCPKSALTLVSGATARSKTVRLSGDPVALAAAVDALAAS